MQRCTRNDSPTIQRLVIQTFADTLFDIVSVSNGDAAIKKLPEIRPHLVLADVYMPGRNGYEVCAFVRNEPQLSGIPVVLLVGAFDAFDADTATQAGASAADVEAMRWRNAVRIFPAGAFSAVVSPANELEPA